MVISKCFSHNWAEISRDVLFVLVLILVNVGWWKSYNNVPAVSLVRESEVRRPRWDKAVVGLMGLEAYGFDGTIRLTMADQQDTWTDATEPVSTLWRFERDRSDNLRRDYWLLAQPKSFRVSFLGFQLCSNRDRLSADDYHKIVNITIPYWAIVMLILLLKAWGIFRRSKRRLEHCGFEVSSSRR